MPGQTTSEPWPAWPVPPGYTFTCIGELSEIALVDVVLPTRNGVTLRKRCIGQPNEHQLVLLQRLGLNLPAVAEFAPM
jgi:hypothetical protein